METTPDNTGYAYLAVSKVVLIMVLVPEEMPEQSLDALASVVPSSDLIKRAWPDPQPHDFPLAALPDGTLANLVKVMRETESEIGLPTLGLTDAQRTGIRTLFDNGTDPAVLQAVFGKDEDMGPTASRIARYLKSMEGQGDNSEGLG
jgi:hypothetical protein